MAVGKLNELLSRSPGYAAELTAWMGAFLASAGVVESARERRLREAACILSEVNWRAHPDYRGVQSFNMVSSAILPGIDHSERSYLSLVVALRHTGLDDETGARTRSLMPTRMIERAGLVGAAIRVAAVLSAGMPDVLPLAPLTAVIGKLVLALPTRFADLASERLQGRIKGLAKLMRRDVSIALK